MKKTIKNLTVLASILFTVNLIGAQEYPELIEVVGGTFTMGDQLGTGEYDELPAHEVTLTDYVIGKTEVTVSQYRAYCDDIGVDMPDEPEWGWDDNAPIVNVSWNDAINYCGWLSGQLGQSFTLPTEAQWEFAARGGNDSKNYKYIGGDIASKLGWYNDNSDNKTHEVATKKPNELGLYDMGGNVWEWCFDGYKSNYYANSPSVNPKNVERSQSKVLRGSSWFESFSNLRAANRARNASVHRYFPNGGFRVASY